jgi:hypothetical protein
MSRSTLLFSVLFTSALASQAAAQTCVGMPSFAAGNMQVAGGGTFTDGANGFAGTFGYGAPKGLYGKAGIGTTSYDALNGSSLDLGLSGGYSIPLESKRMAEVCPVANLSLGRGPNDVGGSGVDMSSRTLGVGASLGVLVNKSSTVQILPNAMFQFADTRSTLDDGTNKVSGSESYGLLSLGTGFVFHSRFSVNPSIDIPVGLDGASSSFRVNGAINFGR